MTGQLVSESREKQIKNTFSKNQAKKYLGIKMSGKAEKIKESWVFEEMFNG